MRILLLICLVLLAVAAIAANLLAWACYGCSWILDRLGDLCLAARARIHTAADAFEEAVR